jgi:hypothetical protein
MVGLAPYTIPSRHTSTYPHHKDVVIAFDLDQVWQQGSRCYDLNESK